MSVSKPGKHVDNLRERNIDLLLEEFTVRNGLGDKGQYAYTL